MNFFKYDFLDNFLSIILISIFINFHFYFLKQFKPDFLTYLKAKFVNNFNNKIKTY